MTASADHRRHAESVLRALRAAGHETYFVGGCVRDRVMGIEPHDFDIATAAAPDAVLKLFPDSGMVGAAFGVVQVQTPTGPVEVATFRADAPYSDGRHPDRVTFSTAREDVLRRDFTINGMLYDPETGETLDWVGGREDIRRRVVRAIGDPRARFAEDKLRLLRAVRFAARFGYAIEEETYAALCATADRLDQVSAERIREELLRLLCGPNAGRGLRLLHDTGLLRPVLPEIEALAGVEQPPQFHPEGDVFEHTCLMLDLARGPSAELGMAVLLHDVGKPSTQTFAEERIRFDEHDKAGEEITRDITRRLKFSNDQTEQIAALVGCHMRFAMVQRMKLSTLKRLLALPGFADHLELHRLDCEASHGKLDNYEFLRRKLEEFSQEEISPPPLITGRELIELGHKPGPRFHVILSAVRDEQLEGRLTDRSVALEFVKAKYPPE
jgi:poly(A) polymerase